MLATQQIPLEFAPPPPNITEDVLSALAGSELCTLWRRTTFFRRIQTAGKRHAGLLERAIAQKREIASQAPEHLDPEEITAYVAENFSLNPREREGIIAFLRSAYPSSTEDRWRRPHDASTVNTAWTVYQKARGLEYFRGPEFISRIREDRATKKRLPHTTPLSAGLGFKRGWTHSGNNTVRMSLGEPTFLYGYSTKRSLWVTQSPIGNDGLAALATADDPIGCARELLETDMDRIVRQYTVPDASRPGHKIDVGLLPIEKQYAV